MLPGTLEMFGPAGTRQLDSLELARNYAIRVQSLRELIAVYDGQIVMLERDIAGASASSPRVSRGAGDQWCRAHDRGGRRRGDR